MDIRRRNKSAYYMSGEYRSDKLRKLLVERGWFAHGDDYAYCKLLRSCDDPAFEDEDVISMIYVNSDAEYEDIRTAFKAL